MAQSRRRAAGGPSPGKRGAAASVRSSEEEEESRAVGGRWAAAWSESEQSQDEGYTSPGGAHYARRVAARKRADHGAKRLGVTLNGLRVFALPELHSQLECLFLRWYSIPSLVAWAGFATSLGVAWQFPRQPGLILVVAVFWRVCQNVGLGLLLKRQSDEGALTSWVTSLREKPFSQENEAVSMMLRSSMAGDFDVLNDHTLPPSYPAWVVLRTLVNIVEANDVFAFTLTAVMYGLLDRAGALEGQIGGSLLARVGDMLGVLLVALSLYSKLAARRIAGDYAWYWGDFFFIRTGDVELSFDGVFDLFPHPMYTVGYGWTYGCALLARSFTVLACGMAFHLSQLAFLTLVEVPHVEKLYAAGSREELERGSPAGALSPPLTLTGKKAAAGAGAAAAAAAAEAEARLAASRPWLLTRLLDLTGVRNFDVFSDSDVTLAMAISFFVLGTTLGSFPGGPLDDDAFFVVMALVWHIVAAVVKTYVLVRQEHGKFWTRRFRMMGKDSVQAFRAWKGLYQLVQTLALAAFHMCAVRLFSTPAQWADMLRAQYVVQILSGVLLVVISVWSFASCYEVLGDYGWYYGDFFLPPAAASEWKKHQQLYQAPLLAEPGQPQQAEPDQQLRRRTSNRAARGCDVYAGLVVASGSGSGSGGVIGGGGSGTSTSTRSSSNNNIDDKSAGTSTGTSSSAEGPARSRLSPESSDTDQDRSSEADMDVAQVRPSYEGIYRYINNPDAYLGHLWMYGYALICSSPDLCVVALLSHAMKIAFLQAVEKPHFRQVYKQHARVHSTALSRAIKGKVRDIRSNEKAVFLANWMRHPIETGALAPSSEQLAAAMCETMHLGDNSVVVELGPGTGPFTKEVLRIQQRHKNTTYLAFELSDEFIAQLQKQFPQHKDCFLKESAEHICRVLRERGIKQADTVISGLPWAIFPASLQQSILDQVVLCLKPGGRFCTFAYLQGLVLPAGQNFKALLDRTFGGSERSPIVWKNLPPAFVYRCEKKKDGKAKG
jgi:phospholipid N-methyltransferase